MVNVDKNIPLPARGVGAVAAHGNSKWPWRKMKMGDSFFAAGYAQSTSQRKNGQLVISTTAGVSAIPGSKWATRLVTENGVRGVRVWRVL